MYRLKVLGGFYLEAEDGRPIAAIRRRGLALLAILAAAGRGGISRDMVLLYLWPDSPTARARNSLSQALVTLRRSLGEDAIEGTTNLRLNPARFSCDLWELRRALEQNLDDEVIEHYGGVFLSGFTLPGLEEFESWADGVRETVEESADGALQRLASAAQSKGDYAAAADAWLRLAARQPFSASFTLTAMRSLMEAGEPARAIALAGAYTRGVRERLNAEPESEVLALARELSDDLLLERIPAGRDPPLPQEGAQAQQSLPRPMRARARVRTGGAGARGRGVITRSTVLAFVAMVLLSSLAAAIAQWRRRDDPVAGASSLYVIVFPFTQAGSSLPWTGAGLADLVAGDLDAATRIRAAGSDAGVRSAAAPGLPWASAPAAAEAEARRLGAQAFVIGDVVSDATGRVRVRALLYQVGGAAGAPIAHTTVQANASALLPLADTLALQLMKLTVARTRLESVPLDALTTASLPALSAYFDGEAELEAGHYGAATDALRRATQVDPSFAYAFYRLSVAAEWDGEARLAQEAAAEAAALADRLPSEKRRVLEAMRAWRAGDADEAERRWKQAIREDESDAEAWFGLAEVLFHENPLRGRSVTAARTALERAVALDSSNAEALVHLARIASLEGRTGEADRLVKRARRAVPSAQGEELRALRAFGVGDRPGIDGTELGLPSGGGDQPSALSVAIYLDDLDGTEAWAKALLRRDASVDTRAMGHRVLAQTAVARGQMERAGRELDVSTALDPVSATELKALYVAFPFFAYNRTAAVAARQAVWALRGEDPPPVAGVQDARLGFHKHVRLHRLGVLSARLGDDAAARGYADSLLAIGGGERSLATARAFAWSIRAWIAAGHGMDSAALEALDSARWQVPARVFAAEASDRFLRAELLERLGRPAEALGWYSSIAQRGTYELVYLAPAELRVAELLDRSGNAAGAIAHYRRFARRWADADPALQPLVSRARARAAWLESRRR